MDSHLCRPFPRRLVLARVSLSLGLLAGSLAGCATALVRSTLGPGPSAPVDIPEIVVGYAWAGRHADTLVLAYAVHYPSLARHEARWTTIDLRHVPWRADDPGSRAAGPVFHSPQWVPDRAGSLEVPILPLPDDVTHGDALARHLRDAAASHPLSVHVWGQAAAGFLVVAQDPAEPGRLRVARWPAPREAEPEGDPLGASVGRAAARTGAAVVDVVTAPLQFLLFTIGVLRVH